MQNNDDSNLNNLTPDELRAQAILKKRCDQITADDRLFLAQNIAQWRRENQ